MGILWLACAALQSPLVREMREGLERKYRVSVAQDAGDRFDYRLRVRVAEPTHPKGMKLKETVTGLLLDLRLTDYRATIGEQKLSTSLIGGGQMPVEANGLPQGLNVSGIQGPLWLPLLSFYFPSGKDDGEFSVPPFSVAPGLDLTGKGNFIRSGSTAKVSLDTSLVSAGKTLGKLTIATDLDASGWPTKAEGTFVSADGTYRFTVERG